MAVKKATAPTKGVQQHEAVRVTAVARKTVAKASEKSSGTRMAPEESAKQAPDRATKAPAKAGKAALPALDKAGTAKAAGPAAAKATKAGTAKAAGPAVAKGAKGAKAGTPVAPRVPRARRATDSASSAAGSQPQRLRVRGNEKPWTGKELAAVRADLEADLVRLQTEISSAEVDLAGLMRDAGVGAGDDQADAGTATFEREQEISLANNVREVFEQSTRALDRLLDGSYGICESCGASIGKNRLQAFPRATLCVTCKSKQERR